MTISSHTVFYPGSFDPVTYGHLDVIRRGRRLFDRLIVGVGHNPDKMTLFSADERHALVRDLSAEIARTDPEPEGGAPVEVVQFSGLTVDAAKANGATALLRGIRNLSDLQYEIQQAATNREVAGLETVFIVAGQSFAYTSSTLIRQITAMGSDLSVLKSMCPPSVIEELQRKKRENHPLLKRLLADG